jgi:hypothetical protein
VLCIQSMFTQTSEVVNHRRARPSQQIFTRDFLRAASKFLLQEGSSSAFAVEPPTAKTDAKSPRELPVFVIDSCLKQSPNHSNQPPLHTWETLPTPLILALSIPNRLSLT